MSKIQRSLELILSIDAYKLGHRSQYPKKTENIFVNLTPRKSFHKFIKDEVNVFGLDYIVENLYKDWSDFFFNLKKKEFESLLSLYKKNISLFLGIEEEKIETSHLKELWVYGSLPMHFKYKKGLSKIGNPIMVWWNTDKRFFWLPTYIETYILSRSWNIVTSSTISSYYKTMFLNYFKETSDSDISFVDYQGHDFSMRGMSSLESSILSGIGHLSSFSGTDTLPAYLEYVNFYGNKKKSPIQSVPATEHSVMSSLGKDNEFKVFSNLLKQYPSGILSIVSDTYNLWRVVGEFLPLLKEDILNRDGKIVIRPDSGNPIDILFGDKKSTDQYEKDGLIESLKNIFGYKVNTKGYMVLNEKIGIIYGDNMNIENVSSILRNCKKKKISTENIVFGIGGSTYQGLSRDVFGFSVKATHMIIDGKDVPIFKDPKTDGNYLKKSLFGFPTLKGKETIKVDVLKYIEENVNKNN